MALDSETLWIALTDHLRDRLDGFKSVERRPRQQYTDVELPVLIVADDQGREALLSDPDDPAPLWKLGADLLIIARTDETDQSPTSQLNALVTAVRSALEFDAAIDVPCYCGRLEYYTSLGGKVHALAIIDVDKFMGAATNKPTAQLTLTMEALG